MKTKVTRVTASAPHCMQLAAVGQQREQNRSGERGEGDEGQDDVIDIYRGVHRFLWVLRLRVNLKATTEADPYGMTNKKTNDGKTKALMRPNSPSEDHDEEDSGCAEREPAGVRANVAGLNAADE